MSGRKHPRDKRIANRAVQALIVKAQILALANKENEQAIEERLLNERRKKYSEQPITGSMKKHRFNCPILLEGPFLSKQDVLDLRAACRPRVDIPAVEDEETGIVLRAGLTVW